MKNYKIHLTNGDTVLIKADGMIDPRGTGVVEFIITDNSDPLQRVPLKTTVATFFANCGVLVEIDKE